MPSSIVTAIPSGTVSEFCIRELYYDFDGTEKNSCANSTRGTQDSDFETICCAGWIVDTSQDLWTYQPNRTEELHVDLANLVCCQVEGDQQGGILPIIPGDGMSCTEGSPTPLASLAATNIDNAAGYLVTYTSAKGVGSSIGDFIPTKTPYCLWADTAHGVAMQTVTVEAAVISTPTPTEDRYGNPLTTTSSFDYSTFAATTSSVSSPSSTSRATALAPILPSWLGWCATLAAFLATK